MPSILQQKYNISVATPASTRRTRSTDEIQTLHLSRCNYCIIAVVGLLTASGGVESAPAEMTRWGNPCGLVDTLAVDAAHINSIPLASDRQIIDRISNYNRIIRPNADTVLDSYVANTFNMNAESLLADWPKRKLTWLKAVTESVANFDKMLMASDGDQQPDSGQQDQWNGLTLESALEGHYANLQVLAVGFEQMLVDAETRYDTNVDGYRLLQSDLSQLMCELHLGLLEKKVTPVNARADIMVPSWNTNHSLKRKVQNWILIREYKSYLKHLHEALNYLRGHLRPSQL